MIGRIKLHICEDEATAESSACTRSGAAFSTLFWSLYLIPSTMNSNKIMPYRAHGAAD